MNTSSEKLWQVLGFGNGFARNGVPASVELSGFVRAPDPDLAWKKAVALARIQSPELTQTDATALPRAVLNCDEIQDATSLEIGEDGIDRVELHWARQ